MTQNEEHASHQQAESGEKPVVVEEIIILEEIIDLEEEKAPRARKELPHPNRQGIFCGPRSRNDWSPNLGACPQNARDASSFGKAP